MTTQHHYQPVSCALHSELELALIQQRQLLVKWQDPGTDLRHETLSLLDLVTRNGAEFLKVKNSAGDTEQIRLDRILTIQPV